MPSSDSSGRLILGIESSCDETGFGIVRLGPDGSLELLADEVASSVEEHARFGGVVPEVASRAHLEALVPTLRRALDTSGVELYGMQAKLGLDLAAKAINAEGGILGRPVEVIYEDDKTDPKTRKLFEVIALKYINSVEHPA